MNLSDIPLLGQFFASKRTFSETGKGLVPAPGSGNTGKLLRGDGTWVAQPLNYLGRVAGDSVPATATTAGDYYLIDGAGTSQSVEWADLDFAIYTGTSGEWDQVTFAAGLLYAGNNLSDLGNAATARTNLGIDTLFAQTDASLAARAPLTGLHVTATGAQRGAATIIALGTGDAFLRVSIPSMGAVGTAAPLWYSAASGNNRVQLRLSTGRVLSLRFTDDEATETDYTFTGYALTVGGAHDLTVTLDRDGNAVLYDFGTAVAAVDISAASAIALAASTTGGIYGAFVGVVSRCEYGNVALSADEVSLLHRFGWAALPWYVHAGGAGQVLSSWDLSSGLDGWSAVGSAALTHDTDHGAATGVASFSNRLELSGSLASRGVSSGNVGKRLGITLDIRGITPGEAVRIYDSSSGQPLVADFTEAGRHDFTVSASLNTLATIRIRSADGDTIAFDLYSGGLTTVGLCGAWDFSKGAGYQERDRSGGKRPLLLTTSGVDRIQSGDTLRVETSLAFSGTTPLQLTGQAVLPDLDWRLDYITAESDTTITLDIGNVSGGSQVVAAAALTANTPADLTIAQRLPTTANLWGKASETANVTITAVYRRITTIA